MIPSRFILGFAVGGASVTVPIYLSEMAPTEWRGRLSARNEVAVVFGQLLAFVVNAILATTLGHHEGVWRYMLAVAAIPAIMLFIGMLSMPESPRWLVSKGRTDEALAVLKQVRPEDRAEAELNEVIKLAQTSNTEKTMTVREGFRKPWIRKLLLIGTAIAVIQQLTGINSVMFYGTEILKVAGFTADVAIVANIANGILSVTGMLIGLKLISRLPRRSLILFGLGWVAALHLAIAIADWAMPESTFKSVLTMILIVLFVGVMQACLGLVIWVVLGEMFPLRIRGAAIGFAVFWMWIANATVAFTFPTFIELCNIEGTLLLFAVLNLLSFLTVKKWLPETGDRSLEQLEEEFALDDN